MDRWGFDWGRTVGSFPWGSFVSNEARSRPEVTRADPVGRGTRTEPADDLSIEQVVKVRKSLGYTGRAQSRHPAWRKTWHSSIATRTVSRRWTERFGAPR